jgi:hypothetical protein
MQSKQQAGYRVANSSGVKIEAGRVSETSVNFNRTHSVTSQKAIFVVANVRTSCLTLSSCFSSEARNS